MSEGNGGMPEGWVITTLGELVAPSTDKVEPANWADAPYLSLEHIEAGTRRIIGWGAGADVTSTKSRFRQGDVLYGRLRPYLNKVCIPDVDGICSTDILVLPPGKAVDNRFLLYFLSRPGVVEYATQNANGINLPRISFDRLADLEFHLPPLPEQRRIVARIEELQARTRRAREALESVPALLEQLRQSVLASAFRGDLTADWRESHPGVEPASVLLERIRAERRRRWEEAELKKMRAKGKEPRDDRWKEKYEEPKPVGADVLPELPDGWTWSSIDQICYVVRGASPRPAGDPRYFNGQSTPWITVGELTKDEEIFLRTTASRLTDAGRELSRYVAPGTLLLTNSGVTLGVPKITAIGGCINDGSVALLGVGDELQLYLYYFLASRTKALRAINQGAAQPNLNTDIVRSIRVPLPPEVELREVVNKIGVLLSLQRRAMTPARAIPDAFNLLDDTVLAKAFRGELLPQDPSDEPASVLLDRIRQERERHRHRGRKA